MFNWFARLFGLNEPTPLSNSIQVLPSHSSPVIVHQGQIVQKKKKKKKKKDDEDDDGGSMIDLGDVVDIALASMPNSDDNDNGDEPQAVQLDDRSAVETAPETPTVPDSSPSYESPSSDSSSYDNGSSFASGSSDCGGGGGDCGGGGGGGGD